MCACCIDMLWNGRDAQLHRTCGCWWGRPVPALYFSCAQYSHRSEESERIWSMRMKPSISRITLQILIISHSSSNSLLGSRCFSKKLATYALCRQYSASKSSKGRRGTRKAAVQAIHASSDHDNGTAHLILFFRPSFFTS